MINTFLRIRRNTYNNKMEIIAIREDGDQVSSLARNGWVPVQEMAEFTILASLPYNTEIEIQEEKPEHHSLLKQKHQDKNDHIENLNNILNKVLDK